MQFFRKSHSVGLGQTTHGFHSSKTLDRICVSERISHDARNDLSLRRCFLVEEIDWLMRVTLQEQMTRGIYHFTR